MEVHRDEKSLKAKELQNGTKTSTSDTKKPLNLYVPSIYFLDVPTFSMIDGKILSSSSVFLSLFDIFQQLACFKLILV